MIGKQYLLIQRIIVSQSFWMIVAPTPGEVTPIGVTISTAGNNFQSGSILSIFSIDIRQPLNDAAYFNQNVRQHPCIDADRPHCHNREVERMCPTSVTFRIHRHLGVSAFTQERMGRLLAHLLRLIR